MIHAIPHETTNPVRSSMGSIMPYIRHPDCSQVDCLVSVP